MPHDDLFGHAKRGQGVLLKRAGVDGLCAREVQLHVDECATQVFHRAGRC